MVRADDWKPAIKYQMNEMLLWTFDLVLSITFLDGLLYSVCAYVTVCFLVSTCPMCQIFSLNKHDELRTLKLELLMLNNRVTD